MRQYDEPAEVQVDGSGYPVRFRVGRHTFKAEVLEPHTEAMQPWWTTGNLGRGDRELRRRHFRLLAHGVHRNAVMLLVEQAGKWRVIGVED
jgi:hypothetical protein